MSFWGVVFIVLMLLWLFSGCYFGWNTSSGQPNFVPVIGTTLIPWCCVAILGYIVLGGGGAFLRP
jgi:hypothetical protein